MSQFVLVTGGTGVVGQAAVSELVSRGHRVRLLSRNAVDDVEQWRPASGDRRPASVDPWPASVTEVDKLRGAADGVDVVLHVAGIVAEDPPDSTFQSVNV